jgi:cobalamin biosynthesis Mg chelatase CobN
MVVGKRQRSAQGLGRLALLSVSALVLALAFFPALAQAECTSSSCIEYTESLPEAGGGNSNHHKQNPARVSKSGQGNGSSQTGPEGQGSKEAESEGESSQQSGATPSGNEGGPPQGNGGGSHNGEPDRGKALGGQGDHGSSASESSDGGDSSPLVPILIAIAALAAISVAAVMYRQRRQRRGPSSSASPEAS